ncbi:hypothetical protein CGH99_23530 [Vibrio parahaemolyticus]|uniref:hypothetical protein n=1 Tax=Vibrio parahaemolyticus TaxID=670 RepID=UPI00111DE9A9|nr:hypothetical protein [Vibrio parahaemolyticus]TOL33468.1 hypothetical protein CGH99_23530 [Vibrio parahaemolyticus]TOL49100.1 hypothetical protein CGH96_20205 [Vibrio parahaemolyticus]TOL65485.1 hypothetical protein CGH92_24240 [Vibrio parahaemolyticus]TOO63318.1 hypothetical protein CGH32_24245 [Vibrio parahaemolyticus]
MDFLQPNRRQFESDPFSYSAQGYLKWNMLQAMATGCDFDPYAEPKMEDLKSPVLWLAQAEALTQAALAIFKSEPKFETMPLNFKGVCDSQFCAVGLMLVGYSLEVALKAMMVIEHGVDGYLKIEKTTRHHRLHELANFVPALSKKDKAVLRALTHFVYWAGRYPDPGSGREGDASNIFEIAEKYEITAHDLFSVAAKVMKHTEKVVEKNS